MSQVSSSLTTPTLSDVESAFNELDEAIIGHTKWLKEWNTRLICGIPVEDKYISETSYRESYFGRWYYGKHADFLSQTPLFDEIGKHHRMVHDEMRAIVSKVNRGETIAREEYDTFIRSEALFSEAIINLRDDIFKLLLSFDHLTGAFNRQAFFQILEQEHARIDRIGESGCVVLMDVDHFKHVNDEYGHAAGDKVLASLSGFVIDNMRPYDAICRYGGEEFLICMPVTTAESAYATIDRIREKLSRKDITLPDGRSVSVSASFGIAQMSSQEEIKETIEHADRALYQAKLSGRNKVVVWSDSASKSA